MVDLRSSDNFEAEILEAEGTAEAEETGGEGREGRAPREAGLEEREWPRKIKGKQDHPYRPRVAEHGMVDHD